MIGYIEPHGRIETERLLEGLERLPPLAVRYRGMLRRSSIWMRRWRAPHLLLVDELAHTNIAGGEPPPRHPKRWQDVEELLDAGINVWTTVNVQHLESLNDLDRADHRVSRSGRPYPIACSTRPTRSS